MLGTNPAQATVKFDSNNPTQAIGIENLAIGDTLYNVVFTREIAAERIYGKFPGTFDFTTEQEMQEAADAVNIELNNAGAQTVGATGSDGLQEYLIGFDSQLVKIDIPVVIFLSSRKDANSWLFNLGPEVDSYELGFRIWADFTMAGSAPVTIGGTVTGLEGSGLVLQNNASDDETIDADGDFTFDTPLTPGTSYNVTVFIHPVGQICSVENGSGTVPAEAVTNVAVSCAEAPVATVSTVAAEGDTLPDETILMDILVDGGVAINLYGQVAFGGRDADSGNDAVFTQAGKVVEEGGTLTDDTTLVRIKGPGQVAISAGDTVAFHGAVEEDFSTPEQPYLFAAVFTQDGVVAAEGDTVEGLGTLERIYTTGKVAINSYDEVAFHGKVGDFRAVFISDGLDTEEKALEDYPFADNTILKFIIASGGVAINDMGEVAFHGRIVDPDSSGHSRLPVKAVFTSNDGPVAKVGDCGGPVKTDMTLTQAGQT